MFGGFFGGVQKEAQKGRSEIVTDSRRNRPGRDSGKLVSATGSRLNWASPLDNAHEDGNDRQDQ